MHDGPRSLSDAEVLDIENFGTPNCQSRGRLQNRFAEIGDGPGARKEQIVGEAQRQHKGIHSIACWEVQVLGA